jgi:hypothetical protein
MRLLHVVKPFESPARAALREATAKRAGYAQAIIEAEAKLERLNTVLDAVDGIARKAKVAKDAAEEARRAWAKTGTYADATAHHALATAADEAARAAQHAAEDAKAVERELPNAQYALRYAKLDLAGCDEDIAAANGLIIVEDEAAFLAEGARIAAQYRAWRVRAKALRLVVDAEMWGHRRLGVASRAAANIVIAALDAATIEPWRESVQNNGSSDPEAIAISQHVARWSERAAQLKGEN